MLLRLMLLFTVVPIIELALLIKLGQHIGVGYTIAVVLITGVAGAYLARTQGVSILRRIRWELEEGRVPGNQIVDGLCVLIGGAMLLTPGLITDLTGFMLVIPVTRIAIREWLKSRFRRMIETGNITFYWSRW